MSSSLSFTKLEIPMARLESSELPDLLGHSITLQNSLEFDLGEDEEIFEGYGTRANAFPYRQQDLYTRDLEEKEIPAAVLENENLRATFLPSLGGRLWSLLDKNSGRNLLYTNDCIRFSNLAVLNAWFSGGVEWNCGVIGHSPFTNAPLCTAETSGPGGCPVLRMYETERTRGVTYQMDFMLPEGSSNLLCRMRVVNESREVVPMYWWSNIAVPEHEGGRVAVPADSAYAFRMGKDNRGRVVKVGIPVVDGVDVTHFKNIPRQVDYFFDLEASPVKFIAETGADGFGLLHVSTARLRSRKMFSWGSNQGSDNWQAWLTNNAGRYLEIQAGLGKTQYGCVPMAPMTSWEWFEAYGPVQLDQEASWEELRDEAASKAREVLSEHDLENLLKSTRDSLAKKKAGLVSKGSEESALLRLLRPAEGRRVLSAHLEFPAGGRAEELLDILTGKREVPSPSEAPGTFFNGKEAEILLEKLNASWYTKYMLGLIAFDKAEWGRCERLLRESLSYSESAWAGHALSCLMLVTGRKDGARDAILKALALRPESPSLLRDTFKILLAADGEEELKRIYESLPAGLKSDHRLRFGHMTALHRTGCWKEAWEIINENGGFVPDDTRECSDELEQICSDLMAKLGIDGEIPAKIRFRSI